MSYYQKICLALIIIIGSAAFCVAETLHVPADFETIQDAIDAAKHGDLILVSPGHYIDNLNFLGKAIHVKSLEGAENTFIDGGFPLDPEYGSVALFENGEGNDSILEGFTLMNGTGTCFEADSDVKNPHGGGVFCFESSPTLKNNTITLCEASSGSGISCYTASPLILENRIIKNQGSKFGGGIFIEHGSSPLIENNQVSENLSDQGGGIFCRKSDISLKYNRIVCNEAYEVGGGACIMASTSILTGNIISGNTVLEAGWLGQGGGLELNSGNYEVTNNIIAHNSARKSGGGVRLTNFSSATFSNNTIVGNSAVTSGGGYSGGNNSDAEFINTIFFFNSAPAGKEAYVDSYHSLTFKYCSVEFGQLSVTVEPAGTLNWGPGMSKKDPLFVDAENEDYHLTYFSPCKDAGNNAMCTIITDNEGDPRIAYGTVDIGADEFYPHLYCLGDAIPNAGVYTRLVGIPNQTACLYISSSVLNTPRHTKYGYWYLEPPVLNVELGNIPWSGIHSLYSRVPPGCPTPLTIPLQGLTRGTLTNLYEVKIKSAGPSE